MSQVIFAQGAEALVSRHAAKLALKDAVRPWLPGALIDRPKQGFAMPLPQWLGGDSVLATKVRETNSSGPLADVLDMERVSQLSAAQARGTTNFTAIVYSAFVLDQWFAKWMPT